MTKCLNKGCENEVISVPGRRPRQYCSNNCRQKDWQRRQKNELWNADGTINAPLLQEKIKEQQEKVKNLPKFRCPPKNKQLEPDLKAKVAPNPEKLPGVPKKEEKAATELEMLLAKGKDNLTIPEMVRLNELKAKEQPKKAPITTFGSTKKERS